MSEELVNQLYKVTDGAIHGFFREHRFLSNYHMCDIEWNGLKFTSTEAAYQAAKCADAEVMKAFTNTTPNEAKKLGKMVKLRPDWEEIKEGIMFTINMYKFTQHPELGEKLLATGDKELVEDNWWGDKYWGRHFGDGANRLGICLMRVRDALRDSLSKL